MMRGGHLLIKEEEEMDQDQSLERILLEEYFGIDGRNKLGQDDEIGMS